jgi:hypothetical protein
MFQDEARFGRISDCCYCWAKFPLRPIVRAMLTHQYIYAYGAVSIPQGNFDSLVLPHVNSACMALFLAEISQRYPDENIVMVLDGAGCPSQAISACSVCRPIALNLTRWSICGMSYARSAFTTERLTAWMRWRITWLMASRAWSVTLSGFSQLAIGSGLLMQFLMRIRISHPLHLFKCQLNFIKLFHRINIFDKFQVIKLNLPSSIACR